MAFTEGLGWGKVIPRGDKFGVVVDKPGTPAQMFGVGNIKPNSFKTVFTRTENRTNHAELTYYDGADEGERKTIEIHRQDWRETDAEEMETSQLDLIGCDDRDEAIYHGQYLMACNQVLKTVNQFEVDVDAIACEVGDLVYLSHDLPQWGYSGRIVSATANTAVLNRSVTMVGGSSYQIMVRSQTTDVLETQALVTVPGTSATVILSGVWTNIPAADAICTFGTVSHLAEDARVISIAWTGNNQSRTITTLEYDSDVYTPDQPVSDDEIISDLVLVDGLVAKEFFRWQDPSARGMVQLTWRGRALSWHVWVGKQPGGDGVPATEFTYLGVVYQPTMQIYDLDARCWYTFVVSGKAGRGAGETVDDF
jgi:hypothetical protein